MFKFMFTKQKKHKKLYKVVYKTNYSSYSERYTLLIPGDSPVDAVDNFYSKVKDKVADILEFTEITYGSDVKKEATEF